MVQLICTIILIIVVIIFSAILVWNTITIQKKPPIDVSDVSDETWKPYETRYLYNKEDSLRDDFSSAIISHIFNKNSFEEIETSDVGKTDLIFVSNVPKKKIDAKMLILTPYHKLENQIKHYAENKDDETYLTILDGEPNDVLVDPRKISLFITTKKMILQDERLKKKSIHIPYFAFSLLEFGVVATDLFANHRYVNMNEWNKREFCFYGQSNASVTRFEGVRNRGKFYEQMKRRFGVAVRNLGTSDRNLNVNSTQFKQINSEKYIDKFKLGTNMYLMKEFKFCICFENCALEGYVTEKITEPLLGHAIPIYCGASDVNKYINAKCFINVNDYKTWDMLFDDLESLQKDENRLKTILQAPVFVNKLKNVPVIKSFIEGKGVFFQKCFDILPIEVKNHICAAKLYECNIRAITFADGVNCSSERIEEEMKSCGYFDSYFAFDKSDIDEYNPIFKHWKTQKTKKGYGWYAWKSFFVYQSLLALNDGDLLTYLDCGSHLKKNFASEIVQYYDSLINTEKDIFAFEINYLENSYSKSLVIEEVKRMYPENADEKLKSSENQICATNIIFKKNAKTLAFAKEWMELSFKDDMKYINDDISKIEKHQFIAHRHDQSIFSLLCKLGDCNVKISKDCFYDDKFDDEHVIQPRRWRN
jgi:hypothetical protein